MKKVALYGRVSSSLQEKEKTINSQMAELREICKDFEIVKEYTDEGWSGGTLARPALDELRDDATKGTFEAVYFHSPDRLARKYAYQVVVLEELKKKEIEVLFLNKAVSDVPEDQLLLGVQGLIAEFEKAKILERTRRGRIHKARTKGIVGGYASYGYDYVKKTKEKDEHYAINDAEKEIVNLIFDLYIELKSSNAVRNELCKRNIMPKRGGVRWCRSVITKILRNESYIGIGYYNKYKSVEIDNGKKYNKNLKTGRQKRDKSEWIPTPYPMILTKEKFETVQKILGKNYKPYGHTKNFYLLSGMIRCAKCGSTFTGEAKRKGRFCYYRCNHRHKRYPLPDTCNAPVVRTDDLDSPVWDELKEAITDSDLLKQHIAVLAEDTEGEKEILESKKEDLLKKQYALNQKRSRLIEIYTEGGINKDQFTEKNNIYNTDETVIKEALAEIAESASTAISKPMVMERLNYFCNMAANKLEKLTLTQKREFLWSILEKILFDAWKREATIIGNIDIDENQPVLPDPLESSVALRTNVGTPHMFWNHCANQLKKEKLLFLAPKTPLLFPVVLC